nr:MAG: zer-1-like protein [Metapenaeus ensis nimavirus]
MKDEDLKILLSHDVDELHMNNCFNFTKEGVEDSVREKSLRVLEIVDLPIQFIGSSPFPTSTQIPITRHLEKLVVHNSSVRFELFEPHERHNLKHLEILPLAPSASLRSFPNIKNLTVLKIPNANETQKAISTILEMVSLVDLDISVLRLGHLEIYENPQGVLKKLVETLKVLVRLDISGTNLLQPKDGNAAFKTRMNCPFDFVGAYRTPFDTQRSSGHYIPAREMAGTATELQFTTTIKAYMNRSIILHLVLNDYKKFLETNSINDDREVFCTIMKVMRVHQTNLGHQLDGIQVLSHISRRGNLTSEDQQLMIQLLLEEMEIINCNRSRDNAACKDMCENACQVLCELIGSNTDLAIPYHLLLNFLLPRINHSICRQPLLDLLHCIVPGSLGEEEKEIVGIQHGAIEILLEGIRKFGDGKPWEILGALTDKAPNNCKKFIESIGEEFIRDQLKVLFLSNLYTNNEDWPAGPKSFQKHICQLERMLSHPYTACSVGKFRDSPWVRARKNDDAILGDCDERLLGLRVRDFDGSSLILDNLFRPPIHHPP